MFREFEFQGFRSRATQRHEMLCESVCMSKVFVCLWAVVKWKDSWALLLYVQTQISCRRDVRSGPVLYHDTQTHQTCTELRLNTDPHVREHGRDSHTCACVRVMQTDGGVRGVWRKGTHPDFRWTNKHDENILFRSSLMWVTQDFFTWVFECSRRDGLGFITE